MTDFDAKAAGWDQNPMKMERAASVADALRKCLENQRFRIGMEYGCGTGLLGVSLQDMFDELLMADASGEMLNMLKLKLQKHHLHHLKPVQLNLENEAAPQSVDILFSLMVLHHVEDIDAMVDRWLDSINCGGMLMIADLEEDDGSYHPNGDTCHNGINSQNLAGLLRSKGLCDIRTTIAYTIEKEVAGKPMAFPVFMITGRKAE